MENYSDWDNLESGLQSEDTEISEWDKLEVSPGNITPTRPKVGERYGEALNFGLRSSIPSKMMLGAPPEFEPTGLKEKTIAGVSKIVPDLPIYLATGAVAAPLGPTGMAASSFGFTGALEDIVDRQLEEKEKSKFVQQVAQEENMRRLSKESFGLREDGTPKGNGFFGKLKRPDGMVSTELSIGVNLDGKETLIPLLVPTLSQQEVDYLLEGNKPTKEIMSKAVSHAKERIKTGKSPFIQEGESTTKIENKFNDNDAIMRLAEMDVESAGKTANAIIAQRLAEGKNVSAVRFAKEFVKTTETLGKGAILGAAVSAGGVAGKMLGKLGGFPGTVGGLVIGSAALEQRLPTYQEFVEATTILGGLHLLGVTPGKLKGAYDKYKYTPQKLMDLAQGGHANEVQAILDDIKVEEVPTPILKKSARPTRDTVYLGETAKLKAELGEEVYYQTLKDLGLEKSNQIRSSEAKTAVLNALKSKVVKIPEFKTPQEAAKFGLKATPEQKEKMQKEADELSVKAKTLIEERGEKSKKAMEMNLRVQSLHEALDAKATLEAAPENHVVPPAVPVPKVEVPKEVPIEPTSGNLITKEEPTKKPVVFPKKANSFTGELPKEGFLPATMTENGTVYVGAPGTVHGVLLDHYNLLDIPTKDGFVDKDGKFYTAEEAGKKLGKDVLVAEQLWEEPEEKVTSGNLITKGEEKPTKKFIGYHGTTEPVFEKFDRSKFGTGKFGSGKEGFYFSADRINAETYHLDFDKYREDLDEWSKDTTKPKPELQKKNLYEVELDIKNPKVFDSIEEIEKIKESDISPYDGAITYDDGFGGKAKEPTEMVVFKPEQIKILRVNDKPFNKKPKFETPPDEIERIISEEEGIGLEELPTEVLNHYLEKFKNDPEKRAMIEAAIDFKNMDLGKEIYPLEEGRVEAKTPTETAEVELNKVFKEPITPEEKVNPKTLFKNIGLEIGKFEKTGEIDEDMILSRFEELEKNPGNIPPEGIETLKELYNKAAEEWAIEEIPQDENVRRLFDLESDEIDRIDMESWKDLFPRPITLDMLGLQQIYDKSIEVLKTSPSFENLRRIGRGIVLEGKTKYGEFRIRMKEIVGDLWNSVRTFVRKTWKDATTWGDKVGQRGMVSWGEGRRLKKDEIAHGTDEDKVESILRDGLRAGSSVGKQAVDYPIVLIFDKTKLGVKEIPHNPGDYATSHSAKPKAAIIYPEDYKTIRSLDEIEDAIQERLEQLERNLIEPDSIEALDDPVIRRLNAEQAESLDRGTFSGEDIFNKYKTILEKQGIKVYRGTRSKTGETTLDMLGLQQIYEKVVERFSKEHSLDKEVSKAAQRRYDSKIKKASKLDIADLIKIGKTKGLNFTQVRTIAQNEFGYKTKLTDLTPAEADSLKIRLDKIKARTPLAEESKVLENPNISPQLKKKFSEMIKTYEVDDFKLEDHIKGIKHLYKTENLNDEMVKRIIESTVRDTEMHPYEGQGIFQYFEGSLRRFGPEFIDHWIEYSVKRADALKPFLRAIKLATKDLTNKEMDRLGEYSDACDRVSNNPKLSPETKLQKKQELATHYEITPRLQKARDLQLSIFEKARQVFKIENPREDYFPRMSKRLEDEVGVAKELTKYLKAKEEGKVHRVIPLDATRDFIFGHELERLPVGGLKDIEYNVEKVLTRYVLSGSRKLFGNEALKKIKPLIAQMEPLRQQEAKDWINTVIRKEPTLTEKALNDTFRFIKRKLHLKVSEGDRAYRDVVGGLLDLNYSSYLGMRPKLVIRNYLQHFLTAHEAGWANFLEGYSKAYSQEVTDAMGESYFMRKRMESWTVEEEKLGLKDISKEVRDKLLWAYRKVDIDTCRAAFSTGYYMSKKLNPRLDPKYWRAAGDKMVRNTQWGYGHDLPIIFHNIVGKTLLQYSTWPLSYADHIIRMVGKERNFGGYARMARTMATYALAIGLYTQYGANYMDSFLFGTIPNSLGWAGKTAKDLWLMLGAIGTPDLRKTSKDVLKDAYGLAPGYLASKEISKLIETGDLAGYLFYMSDKKSKMEEFLPYTGESEKKGKSLPRLRTLKR